MTNKKTKNEDYTTMNTWFYNPIVKEHFYHPKNYLKNTSKTYLKKFNGYGRVGSPVCGDVMEMWIKIDPITKKIKECKWRTWGCASAIASTSMLSVMITEKGGMPIDKALKINAQDIIKKLGGLPAQKIHCSVLGDQVLQAAINDYLKKEKK